MGLARFLHYDLIKLLFEFILNLNLKQSYMKILVLT